MKLFSIFAAAFAAGQLLQALCGRPAVEAVVLTGCILVAAGYCRRLFTFKEPC